MQQVTGAIVQELATTPPSGPTSASGSLSLLTESIRHGPVRILKVALDPAELGHVTVNLRLAGETLDMTVTAERAETVSMLDRDRHLLSRMLEASGYSANDVTIQSASTTLQPTPTPARAVADGQSDPQAAPQSQSHGSEGERRPARQDSGQRYSRQEVEREKQDLNPRRGDVYV
jgi:chemotaxis protein MotD